MYEKMNPQNQKTQKNYLIVNTLNQPNNLRFYSNMPIGFMLK